MKSFNLFIFIYFNTSVFFNRKSKNTDFTVTMRREEVKAVKLSYGNDSSISIAPLLSVWS